MTPDLEKIDHFKGVVLDTYNSLTDAIKELSINELHHDEVKSALDLFLAGLNAVIKEKESSVTKERVDAGFKQKELKKVRMQILGK